MKSARICLLSLVCAGGAVGFGVIANAAMDIFMPVAAPAATAPAVTGSLTEPRQAPIVAAVEEVARPAKGGFALASATATPVDLGPVKVKTIPMVYRETVEEPAAAPAPAPAPVRTRAAAVPLPRPRPVLASVEPAGQSAVQAIAAATKNSSGAEDDPLSPASIDRIKTALALTSEQETYWPAVAAELKAIAKAQPTHKHGVRKGQVAKIDIDRDTAQRLYWTAAPLITRLSFDQKQAVKKIALQMGLTEVAEAL